MNGLSNDQPRLGSVGVLAVLASLGVVIAAWCWSSAPEFVVQTATASAIGAATFFGLHISCRKLWAPLSRGLSDPEKGVDGARLGAILDTLEPMVAVIDAQGRVLEANASWRDFQGSDSTCDTPSVLDVLAERLRDPTVIDDLREAISAAGRGDDVVIDSQQAIEVSAAHRDVVVRLRPLRGGSSSEAAAVLIIDDQTEANTRERDLRIQKQRAETLASALETSTKAIELAVNGGNLGLWHWDVNTSYFELSRDWLVALGHDDADLGADVESFREYLHPDDRVLWTAEDAASLAIDEPYDRQFRLRRANGTYAWAQALGRANSRRDDGAPESLSGIFLDIDARKNVQLQDAGMAKIIEESFNEIFVIDSGTWRFVQVNRGARENLGLTLEEMARMTPADINPEFDFGQLDELVAPLRSGAQERIEFETTHRRRDGSTYPVLINLQKSELVGREVFVAIGMDLTHRRKLEAQLANSQKLESIGQLAAGIAHEMNTPLQYVGNNIAYLTDCADRLFEVIDLYEELLADDAPQPWSARIEEIKQLREQHRFDRLRQETPKALAESHEGVQRVLTIVRAMKEFSHPGDQQLAPTDLNQLVTSMVTVTRNRWKYTADLQLNLDPALPVIRCDAGSINQVIVNLIVNAADAISGGEESPAEQERGRIDVATRSDGDRVVLEVRDNGCGMPPDVVRRVFDPFFTTKEVGKGTGQGLSLSHTIVTERHNGTIQVDSTPGIGTTFIVSLPVDPHPSVDTAPQHLEEQLTTA